MALPHYKLHTESLPDAPASYPVLLAPSDTQTRFSFIKQALQSRKLLIGVQIIAITTGATLLWLLLDPTLTAPKPIFWLIPAVTLGLCFLFFIFISIVKNKADKQQPVIAEEWFSQVAPPNAKIIPPPRNLKTELYLEQWSSKPFQEIMDEAVLAEVFNDDLVAPDHLVLSVKITD